MFEDFKKQKAEEEKMIPEEQDKIRALSRLEGRTILEEPKKITKEIDGKFQVGLLLIDCYQAVEEIIKVFEFGTKKYYERSWQANNTEKGKRQLIEAINRHLFEYIKGNELDGETKLHHMAAIATNAIFLIMFYFINKK